MYELQHMTVSARRITAHPPSDDIGPPRLSPISAPLLSAPLPRTATSPAQMRGNASVRASRTGLMHRVLGPFVPNFFSNDSSTKACHILFSNPPTQPPYHSPPYYQCSPSSSSSLLENNQVSVFHAFHLEISGEIRCDRTNRSLSHLIIHVVLAEIK